jgi:DNA topoisomerase VI subunit A
MALVFEQARACFFIVEYFSLQPEPVKKTTKKNTPEQQALAKYGPALVTDTYPPEKPGEIGVI